MKRLKDILKENKQGFTGKSRTLTHFVAFEEYMADKAILSVSQKPSRSVLLKVINFDSATLNISVFIQPKKHSFQNDISLKSMTLGVLS